MPEKTKKRKLIGKYKMIDGKLVYDTRADKFRRDHMPYLKYKEPFHNDGFKRFYGTEDEMNKAPGKKKADIYTGRTIRRKKSKDTQRQRRYNPNNPPESVDPDVPRKLKAKAGGIMKVKRLKSGGFVSSGTDAGDLQILRTAKNIDDGSGMKAGGRVKAKIKKVSSMLKKASKAHAGQAKTLDAIKMKSGGVAQKQRKMNEIRKQAIEAYKDPNKRLSKNLRMHMERFKSRNKADATKMKEGGKTKSRVNEAGNYTKPGLRKRIFNRIKAGGKGGRPGQWSARKAQMMAKAYKKAGGGYK